MKNRITGLKDNPIMKRLVVLIFLMFGLASHSFLYSQTVFQLKQDAVKLTKSCYKVTENALSRAGAIWWPNQVDLSKDLTLNFLVYMGDKDAGGADGLGFVFHNDPRGFSAQGERGGGLYFGDHISYPNSNQGLNRPGIDDKIVPSVAIEMDTWQNSEKGCSGVDPWYDHTSVVVNGEVCKPSMAAVQLHKTKSNVEDNTCFNAIIKWNAASKTLQLFFGDKDDTTPDLIFTHSIDVVTILGSTKAYYGFTGSTGGSLNEQTICIFDGSNTVPTAKNDYAATPYGTPITVDVQANDKDSDGDIIYTTAIITNPKHGTCTILGKNQVRYSPNAGYAGLDSLEYRICDIDPGSGSEKCYANCSNAWVIFNRVECPTFPLVAVKVKDNEKCDPTTAPDNGAARAYMQNGAVEDITNFTFKWYKGSYALPSQVLALTPDFTGPSISNLADGPYTVLAELKQNTTCKSVNVSTVTINRVSVLPVFTVSLVKGVTNCIPANGIAEVIFTDPTVKASDYAIDWYEIFPTKIFTGQVFNKAGVKTYTVQVTNLKTGCKQTGTINIPKNYTSPTITRSSTPRTSCSTLNGRLSANVGGNTSNYEFRWGVANDRKLFNPMIGPVQNGLDSGNYWLNVRDLVTGCYYDTLAVRVNDGRVKPQLSFTITAQTSCNPSQPNGVIVATVTNSIAGETFTYQWFKGSATTTPISLPATSSGNTASKLSASTYTVVVTNDVTGCSTTRTGIAVGENKDTPTIVVQSQTNPTSCISPDGSITVVVDPDGAGPRPQSNAGYTFKWWKGASVLTTTPIFTTATIGTLSDGSYTVEATSATGCKANTTVTLIPPPSPTISFTGTNDNSCDPTKPNGTIIAKVSGGVGAYTYRWFRGIGTTTPIPSYNGFPTITGVGEEDFTLVITDNKGCTAQKDTTIRYVPAPAFVVSPTSSPVTCNTLSGSNGSVSASVAGPPPVGGYDFIWFKGNTFKATPDFIGTSWNNVGAGAYTVIAFNKFTNCYSDTATVNVGETWPFSINVSTSAPITGSCLTANATLQVTSATPGLTYEWFRGMPDDTVNSPYFTRPNLGTGPTFSGVAPYTYFVRATNPSTGCIALDSIDLSKTSPVPFVNLRRWTNTNCINPNGKAYIDYVVPDPIGAPGVKRDSVYTKANFSIKWYAGSDTSGTVISNNAAVSNVPGGFYTVVVDVGTCKTPPTTISVLEKLVYPVTLRIYRTHVTQCNTPNGSLRINMSQHSNNPADYTATAKKDNANFPVASFGAITPDWMITGLDVGNYEFWITNIHSGCVSYISLPVIRKLTYPTNKGQVDIVHNTKCGLSASNKGNGSLTWVASAGSPHPNTTLYLYNWYKSIDNSLVGTTTAITDLDPGKYYVIITEIATGCQSGRREFTILDMQTNPIVNIVQTLPQTHCSILDGSVRIKLGPKTPYNHPDHLFTWAKVNSSIVPVPAIANGSTPEEFVASALDSGNYTLTISDAVLGCTTTTPFTIGFAQNLPVVDLDSTDVTACVPNGSVRANITSGTPAFSTTLVRQGSPAYSVTLPGVAPVFNSLLPGDYVATAVDFKTCPSLPVQITVPDKVMKPKLQIVNLNPNFRCTSTVLPNNGMIEVATTPAGVYQYSWTAISGSASITPNSPIITNATAGRYKVKVIDPAVGSICRDSLEIVLRDSLITFEPLVSKFDVTRCRFPYDGMLIASVNGATSGYTFTWTYEDSLSVILDAGAIADSLAPGNYKLVVTNNLTGCSETRFETIQFIPVPIIATLTEDAPLTNCDPTRPNAQWTASVDFEASGYTFDWYEGSSVASGTFFHSGNTAEKMKAVTYTVRITDLLRGCTRDTTLIPTNMPVTPPRPQIDSLRDRTSCVVANGYTRVSVNGNTSDYIFNWYIGNDLKAQPDYIGYEQTGLDIGNYIVTATSMLTGCTSAPSPVTIKDGKIYPEFETRGRNSLCSQNDGQVSITWIDPVRVDQLEMVSARESFFSPENQDVPPGEFQITLTSPEGCVVTKTIKVGSDFLVYNGVSPNGDGKNDKLEIECIELFPNNVVKVFNRAGTLVYVGKGYDNKNVYFNGAGNKGVYATGNELPDGTYYYIVDSGEGKKSQAGFFELLR